jgi:hypothetical protein
MKSSKKAEDYAEMLYNKILRNIVYPLVSNKSTYLTDLDNAGKILLKSKFKGVYPSDKIPKLNKKKPYAIINLDSSGMPGSHWVAIARYKNDVYIYDSFGRDYTEILPSLQKSKNGEVYNTDSDIEQKPSELDCGARCLAWLLLYEYYGVDHAVLI